MKEDQNPFSIYDFLGYLIPGSFLCYGLCGFRLYFHGTNDFVGIIKEFADISDVNLIIPFILISYIAGHMVSYISSITIERYSIWTLGYPSEFLFKQSKSRMYDFQDKQCLRCLLRTATFCVIFPITLPEFVFGRLFKGRMLFTKQLDSHLGSYVLSVVEKIHANAVKFEYNQDENTDVQEKDYFRILYHYAIEKFPAHRIKMQNYVALYGFTRTVSFVFVVFFWISLLLLINKGMFVFYISTPVLMVLSFLMYLDFVKFYRKFTLETYMAISSSTIESILNSDQC
jgi:hypothetical protein